MDSDLRDKIDKHLRALRAADSQAAAVSWMTAAYKLFERCIEEIDRPEPAARLIFMPPKVIEVVKEIPKYMVPGPKGFVPMKPRGETWWTAKTVVFPDMPEPPPRPRPWTHRDTVRLEAAAKMGRHHIQRQGK